MIDDSHLIEYIPTEYLVYKLIDIDDCFLSLFSSSFWIRRVAPATLH